MKLLWLWIVLLALGAAGCVSGIPPEQAPTQALVPSTSTPLPSPTVDFPTAPAPPGPAEVVSGAEASPAPAQAQVIGAVLADLADRLAVETGEIDVVAVEEVAWTSLACDAEAASITDLERTEGFHVVLVFQGERYSYRANLNGAFVRCEDDALPVGDPVILDTNLSALVELASQDLAQRLDLPLRRVFLVEAYPVMWPDASFGCALTDEEYPSTPVAGYRIVLRVGSESYDYHTNYRQAILCPADAVRLPAATATVEDTAED